MVHTPPNRSLLLIVLLGTGCGGISFTGMAAAEDTPAALNLDLPVLASAGADREVLRAYPTTLRGLGTSHPLHRGFAVRWQQLAGEPVFLSNDNALCPTFTPPINEQDLVFRLEATDGVFSTFDDVILRVKAEPQYTAPLAAAGADRFLAYDEPSVPQTKDIAGDLGTDVTPSWQELVPTRLENAPPADPNLTMPRIYQLSATRYELSSAPDYLLLFPFDKTRITNLAPSASLTGPNLVTPGVPVALDASASSDPNDDHVRLRWDRVIGDGNCLEGSSDPTMSVVAPTRPQELAFRVFASDGVLESAPAELKVVVSAGPDFVVPAVHPGADQRARPGRSVRLDALGGAPRGTQPSSSQTYRWTQTSGPMVELTTEAEGRVALFTAPQVFGTLAFSVYGSVEAVDGNPAVVVTTVVKPEDNLAPTLYVSASDATPLADSWVTLSARAIDPEKDPLVSMGWVQTDGPSVTLVPVGDLDPLISGEAQVKLFAPQGPTTIAVKASACDDRGACGSATISITID
jgi:hypothetical protein